MSLTPAQCRAARALLGWSQGDLAASSKVSKVTLANFELGNRAPYERTLRDIRAAMEAAGVAFIDAGEVSASGAEGVRMASAPGE